MRPHAGAEAVEVCGGGYWEGRGCSGLKHPSFQDSGRRTGLGGSGDTGSVVRGLPALLLLRSGGQLLLDRATDSFRGSY